MGKLEEALDVLIQLGLPKQQQNDRSAYTLLALLKLKENDSWGKASINLLRIYDIMEIIKDSYGLEYAPNTRETIRRQTIHQFVEAGIIVQNVDDLSRATNSPKNNYSITVEALEVIKSYKTTEWKEKLYKFFKDKDKLIEKYRMERDIHQIPIIIGNEEFNLSSGEHNELQKEIIEKFTPVFAPGAKVLYLGDTSKKHLYILENELEILGIKVTQHDKLPDIVLYDSKKNWLYLCEAVTSHGPISPKRYFELEDMLEDCTAGKIYVSCFLTFSTFKKYSDEIAWETEVWIAENPTHLLHYNGDRFMGPR